MASGSKYNLTIILVIFAGLAASLLFLMHLRSASRPNIILITLDALRPDHLGCYGYKRDTSPHIDKIAGEGMIFNQAVAQSSHTAPSNASLITSTYPNIHGVKDFGYQFSPAISKTLPIILKEHGYRTALISDQVALPLTKGFEKGFDTFNAVNSFTFGKLTDRKQIINITDWAIDWIENNKKRRFFLWVYYFDPHGPYISPYPYNKMFVGDRYYSTNKKVPLSKSEHSHIAFGHIPRYLSYNNITDVDFYVSLYDGEIRHIDDQIGRLLQVLKKLGLEKNTIIIINSDHGEAMGEHNRYFCHATSLYDELLKIPLIIKWEGHVSPGAENDTQVRAIDIMPTILDILNIDKPGFMQGASFMPLLGGREYNFPEIAYSEYGWRKGVRTSEWKLIYDGETKRYELYNLKNDPAELKDLSRKEEAQFGFFRKKLEEYDRNSISQKEVITPGLSEDDKERLWSIGYAQ